MQAYEERKQEANPTKIKRQKMLNIIQICLRASALGASIAATWVMFTSNQTTLVFGIEMDAKYSYSPALKFFAFANAIASVFALLSLSLKLIPSCNGSETTNTLFFFIHDLVVMSLLLAGCSAATAIGYIGKYGNTHSGWIPICDHFHTFCHWLTAAMILGYISFTFFLCLTILSATTSSVTHILPFQARNL